MTYTSKINPFVVFVLLAIFITILMVPYCYYVDNIFNIRIKSDSGGIAWPTLIASLFFIGLEIYFLFRVVTRLLIITINLTDRIITFNYPLQFSKVQLGFDEMHSFHFSSFYSRICQFKCLVFKSNSGKNYQITDFEIWNLRIIENIAIDNFELSKDNSNEIVQDSAKDLELAKNLKFDIDQADSYRFFCYLNLVLVVVLFFIDKNLAIPSRRFGLFTWSVCLLLIIYSIVKIVQANRIIGDNK